MTVEQVLTGYRAQAEILAPAYDAVSSTEVFASVAQFFPAPGARILDVGAGTGRDAIWFVQQGYHVTAVEPVPALHAHVAASRDLDWVGDTLPGLARVEGRFDLIVVAAVWQHIPPANRPAAFARLRDLLAPRARIVMSLRHGPGHPDRPVFDIDPGLTRAEAAAQGLVLRWSDDVPSQQAANLASGVRWTWVMFEEA